MSWASLDVTSAGDEVESSVEDRGETSDGSGARTRIDGEDKWQVVQFYGGDSG